MRDQKRTAWRDWYHITTHPYGQWLPGDPRGWSERNHRKHIPGHTHAPAISPTYAAGKLQYSKRLLKGDPVAFSPNDYQQIGALILESLQLQDCPCLALSVKHDHIHMLTRCVGKNSRIVAGKCKRNVETNMPDLDTRMWAKDSDNKPIRDRAHGTEAFQYILDHRNEGARVWSFKNPIPTIIHRTPHINPGVTPPGYTAA